jgi:hypothetical protein
MTDVKLAFIGNKIERHFQHVHGAQTDVCNLFIAVEINAAARAILRRMEKTLAEI